MSRRSRRLLGGEDMRRQNAREVAGLNEGEPVQIICHHCVDYTQAVMRAQYRAKKRGRR